MVQSIAYSRLGCLGSPPTARGKLLTARLGIAGLLVLTLALTGCTALLSPVSGVPANRLPPEFFAKPKNNLQPIDVSRLRQEAPRAYLVDAGDILGLYVQGVLGDEETPPPYHMPAPGSVLPPSIGYPIPVREDGTISLPFVRPISVRGLSLAQVEESIRRAYTVDRQILHPGQDRIIATMLKERTYTVIVMRRDGVNQAGGRGGPNGQNGGPGSDLSTQGQVIELPAYQNDVLHALAQTGGLPGVNAKNEIKILRSRLIDAERRDRFVRAFYQAQPRDTCLCPPPLPEDPAIIRIPLRLPPGATPQFKPTDIILEKSDIVLIEGREREVFYTGGLLGGGEYQLPRDYDLDVLTAMAMVGSGVANPNAGMNGGNMGGGMGGMGGMWRAPPGNLFILRKTPCGDQIIIAVDLNRAIRDPRSRPLIQAGDTIIAQHRPMEDVVNFAIPTFFTYGIAEVFRQSR